jgi:valyl-tRNA synthetase
MQLPQEYNIKESEEKWQKYWEKEKIYKFNENSKKTIFSIDTPPPTVSGKMHIGHAFSYSQQDFIARYHRMKGENIFYPFGTDDNGLPTERLVEKTKNVKAKNLSREKFIELCLNFLKKELPVFIKDWRDIGLSADFNIYYSTINEHSRRVSQWSFLDLYKMKRAYRKEAPAMWCPECKTGVSQVEIKDKEFDTTFNWIIFKIGGDNLEIATTRPELLPACVSLFYYPNDPRFKKYKGKKAKVPLFNFDVPVMEDSRVDPKKGSGIVMCCTFGDQVDMEWQRQYNLQIREAISQEGIMTNLAKNYSGMKIKDARKLIIEDLKKNKLLTKQEKIKHFVNVHERCNTEIEFVKSKQWFIKYLDLKKDFLKFGNNLRWHPKFMKTRYDNWVNGLQWDWLISNQRYFGVPIPVWYCKKCHQEILANEEDLPINPLKDKPNKKCKCGNNEFYPEKDILNTWFTSSMTPQIAIKLMPREIQRNLFPMSLRPQASEIITFWLFNTVFKSNIHYNKNPWKDVMISGFVTLEGEKMSKSKGNVIEPREVLNKYGADALRFWASSSKLGEDTDYQEKDLITGKRTIIKLFNASKLILMNLKDYKNQIPQKLELIDLWLLSKLNNVIKICTESFNNYEYSKAKSEIENFFWNTFCDYYLEIVKDRLYNESLRGKDAKLSAQYTLNYSLLTILKLFAPIMPHITEEIYHSYHNKKENKKSIHLSDWPQYKKELLDKKAEKIGDELISLIAEVRQFKSKNNKSLKEPINITLSKSKHQELKHVLADFKAVTNAKNINFGEKLEVNF